MSSKFIDGLYTAITDRARVDIVSAVNTVDRCVACQNDVSGRPAHLFDALNDERVYVDYATAKRFADDDYWVV